MKTEKEFSKFAKPRLEFYWTIESFEAGGNVSTPDWYLVHPTAGYSIWVELKIVKAGRVEFQPGQCKWLECHTNKGGLAFVLLLSPSPSGGEAVVSLFPATCARWLSQAKLRDSEGISKALSLSLTSPLPLASPLLWESLAREFWEASLGCDSRREKERERRDARRGGEDISS